MNHDASLPSESPGSLDRRNFVRKSALATGAVTFAGLIKAGHGQGPPTTTTGGTTTTMTTLRICAEIPADSDYVACIDDEGWVGLTSSLALAGGGSICLKYKESVCYKKSANHFKQSINSALRIRVEVQIPNEDPWYFDPETPEDDSEKISESSEFSTVGGSIVCEKMDVEAQMISDFVNVTLSEEKGVYSASVLVSSVSRSGGELKVFAAAWLNGGGFDDANSKVAGIALVKVRESNPASSHGHSQCGGAEPE